jgi:hypothetical protein
MAPFTGIATHDKLGQQFAVDGEWQLLSDGWGGGLLTKTGVPLPMGLYDLQIIDGGKVRMRIRSMVSRGKNRVQPFEGVGQPPRA